MLHINVSVNGNAILSGFSNSQDLVPEHAVATKHLVIVNDNRGITIDFKALIGETILNGIQIKRIE